MSEKLKALRAQLNEFVENPQNEPIVSKYITITAAICRCEFEIWDAGIKRKHPTPEPEAMQNMIGKWFIANVGRRVFYIYVEKSGVQENGRPHTFNCIELCEGYRIHETYYPFAALNGKLPVIDFAPILQILDANAAQISNLRQNIINNSSLIQNQ